MAGLRDKLIHHYFGVKYARVWDVITKEIPTLKIQIEKILNEIEKSNESIGRIENE